MPASILESGGTAYCAGAGEDVSFDIELWRRGWAVRIFDPTPRAARYVHAAVQLEPNKLTFTPEGWWGEVTQLKFFAPRDPRHVSHSVVNLQDTEDFFEAEVGTVKSFQERFLDPRVDLIKMDIEGAEYSVISRLIDEGPWPGVLLVEFDQPVPLGKTLKLIRRMRARGYRVVNVERWNFTFQQRGEGVVREQ